MTRLPCMTFCLALALVAGACRDRGLPAVSFTASADAMAVVSVGVLDGCPGGDSRRATALGVWVDGQYAHELLLFGGSGANTATTVIGPLPPGRHAVDLRPSAFWPPVACVRPVSVAVSVAEAGDLRHAVLRHAPVLELRADTVGEQSDVPLYAYAETDTDTASGTRSLHYTVVFSNEDGGTPTRALLARWGRTADIERLYDVTLLGGRVVREEFQGPDHEIRVFNGRRRGAAPRLLVATLNNMVTDRGRGLVTMRLVPELVDLARATRESTLDTRPWAWRVIVAELEREGRVREGAPEDRRWATVAPHPSRHVYLEGRLDLEHAAVAAWVRLRDGRRIWSHYGHAPLMIDRDGWVRTAVAAGPDAAAVVDAGWACLAEPDSTVPGRCAIEATRAFVVDAAGVPGDNLIQPASAELSTGGEFLLKRR